MPHGSSASASVRGSQSLFVYVSVSLTGGRFKITEDHSNTESKYVCATFRLCATSILAPDPPRSICDTICNAQLLSNLLFKKDLLGHHALLRELFSAASIHCQHTYTGQELCHTLSSAELCQPNLSGLAKSTSHYCFVLMLHPHTSVQTL